MIHRITLSCVVVAASLFAIDANAQKLSVVVPANKPPSRDSHFNWEFQSSGGGAARIGQFACGSYWVAPAVGDSGVRVVSLTGNPGWNDLVSCDADPVTESHGLLDGSNHYGSYNAAENIVPRLPLTFSPASDSCVSLVAAMQRNEAETSKGGTKAIVGEVVDSYCIVTILPDAPKNDGADMIRPNITGATKEFLTWADFDLSRIPTYDFLAGKDPQGWKDAQTRWRSSIEIFGMLTETVPGDVKSWRKFSEGGRAFRAHNLIHDYAAGMTRAFNDDLLALFSKENTLEEKKPALAAMLAFGLDIYHARYDYGTRFRKGWSSGAGQSGGKFLPPVLLAALLRDQSKAHVLRKVAIDGHGQDKALLGPQVLRQLTRGVTGVLLWGDGPPYLRDGNKMTEMEWRYWADFKGSSCFDGAVNPGNPSRGKKTAADPYGYIDGPANKPGSAYMAVSFGGVRGLAAAMILMPEIRSIVNTDDPIEYADRVTRHGLWTSPDPVAIPTVEDQTNGSTTWWSANGCVDWGVKWGVNPDDIRFAIEDGTGRFKSMHGQPLKTGYESSQAQKNWETILALYDGPRFEDNAVELGVVVAPEILFETGARPMAHMRCATPDAEIRYTLDGSEPTATSPLYNAPVPVTDGAVVRAKAFLPGKKASSIREKTFRAALR